MRKYSSIPNWQLNAIEKILAELEVGPSDSRDLQSALGMSKRNVNYCLALAKVCGLVYVASWDRKQAFAPVYGLALDGPRRDARRPAALTKAQQMRSYRARRAIEHAPLRRLEAAMPSNVVPIAPSKTDA